MSGHIGVRNNAIAARRWERITLAASVLDTEDLRERLTAAERLAVSVLVRELAKAMDEIAVTAGRVIPFPGVSL